MTNKNLSAPNSAQPLKLGSTNQSVVDEIHASLARITPGPWAWASTNEKGYGAMVGAGVHAEDDADCLVPLSGDLSDREDHYFVEEAVAELGNQNANTNAEFIANAPDYVAFLLQCVGSSEASMRTALKQLERCGKCAHQFDHIHAVRHVLQHALEGVSA